MSISAHVVQTPARSLFKPTCSIHGILFSIFTKGAGLEVSVGSTTHPPDEEFDFHSWTLYTVGGRYNDYLHVMQCNEFLRHVTVMELRPQVLHVPERFLNCLYEKLREHHYEVVH